METVQVDKFEKRKASKREYIQTKRANEAYREMENRKRAKILMVDDDTDRRDKAEKRKASKREHFLVYRTRRLFSFFISVTSFNDSYSLVFLSCF